MEKETNTCGLFDCSIVFYVRYLCTNYTDRGPYDDEIVIRGLPIVNHFMNASEFITL